MYIPTMRYCPRHLPVGGLYPQNNYSNCMKFNFTLIALITASFSCMLNAQQVTDTVSLGAGYANQKWYSLQNDEQGTAPRNNWDIAFECAQYGTSILINSPTGTRLWVSANTDTSQWATLDTTGMAATWPMKYNSDTSWYLGAFSQPQTNQFDLGWGIYNPITHFVDGDSLYVIKLANSSFRKVWIKQLASGTFTFRYATLDNSFDTTVQLVKADFAGELFAYYSMQNNSELSREPLASDWDLSFGQYTAFLPTPYGVTGVLSNNGVLVAQASPIDVTTALWSAYAYVTPINEIGYDWKTLNMQTFQYDIADSTVYFVQDVDGDIWKVIFTGFGGSANGNFIFTKEQVGTASIANNGQTQSFGMYPNPSSQQNVTLITSLGASNEGVINVINTNGALVYSERIQGSGLQQKQISTEGWAPGIYFVSVISDGATLTQKLIVQ